MKKYILILAKNGRASNRVATARGEKTILMKKQLKLHQASLSWLKYMRKSKNNKNQPKTKKSVDQQKNLIKIQIKQKIKLKNSLRFRKSIQNMLKFEKKTSLINSCFSKMIKLADLAYHKFLISN